MSFQYVLSRAVFLCLGLVYCSRSKWGQELMGFQRFHRLVAGQIWFVWLRRCMKGRLSSAPEGCASTKSVWVAQTYPLPNEVHLSGGTPCNLCEYIDLTAAELSKRSSTKTSQRAPVAGQEKTVPIRSCNVPSTPAAAASVMWDHPEPWEPHIRKKAWTMRGARRSYSRVRDMIVHDPSTSFYNISFHEPFPSKEWVCQGVSNWHSQGIWMDMICFW